MFLIVCMFLVGCVTESKIISLYKGSNLYCDQFLLFNNESKTYSHQIDMASNWGETGTFSIKNDTIFLFPTLVFEGDTILKYNCLWTYYCGEERKCIDKRVFISREKYIQDITLSYYYSGDTTAHYFSYDVIPLRKIRIKQTKEENESLKARQKYENLGK